MIPSNLPQTMNYTSTPLSPVSVCVVVCPLSIRLVSVPLSNISISIDIVKCSSSFPSVSVPSLASSTYSYLPQVPLTSLTHVPTIIILLLSNSIRPSPSVDRFKLPVCFLYNKLIKCYFKLIRSYE